MHRLGDRVEVKLIEAAPLAGALRFELLSEGRVLPRKERSRPAHGQGRDMRQRGRRARR
jgi:ribonuclease R